MLPTAVLFFVVSYYSNYIDSRSSQSIMMTPLGRFSAGPTHDIEWATGHLGEPCLVNRLDQVKSILLNDVVWASGFIVNIQRNGVNVDEYKTTAPVPR